MPEGYFLLVLGLMSGGSEPAGFGRTTKRGRKNAGIFAFERGGTERILLWHNSYSRRDHQVLNRPSGLIFCGMPEGYFLLVLVP